ncbi:oxygen-dependent protoporphyrinogen oxidase [Ancylobacter sp. 3268]|uniref:protoporphyrinogen/coproporphyrinogen oxidase n=1 Tax=Ancylobacter sp. 3268 TaxID=2817752 RepID=UPI0028649C76|nr:NAD(P)/FAD-dependent oxidoreductase [Ancylobacter sp. 3268]MDR6955409.1 oxygen-dependent protoporphyrinogen oxidase [Ancylobacter sp. 3268]
MAETGMHDVVIIGGGIGGLSGAWRLRHRDVLVLEAGARPGGRLRSERRGDYWLNFGAHLFGESASPAGALADELGLEARPIPGDRMGIAFKGKVVAGGRSETFPLRLPLDLGARLSFVKMGLKLRSGVMRLLEVQKAVPGEPPGTRRMRQLSFENGRTLENYVGALTPDTELILRTITERTAADPSEMAAGYGLTSFAQVWSKHSFGRNLFGGSSRLPEAIASALGDRLHLNAEAISVEQKGEAVEIAYRQGGELRLVRARHAIVATPATVSAKILRGLPAETAEALGRIRYGTFLSAAVLTSETGPMPWDANYAIATPGLSFGVFFNQASTLRVGPRKAGGSLMLFRGARGADELIKLSDDEIARRFKADLEKLFPQARGIVEEIVIQRWPLGAPYSFPGRAALQSALTRDLGRLHLAGDYLEFPCMDAAIATAGEAAAAIELALTHPA